jgi:hypothetical protein
MVPFAISPTAARTDQSNKSVLSIKRPADGTAGRVPTGASVRSSPAEPNAAVSRLATVAAPVAVRFLIPVAER